MAKSSIESDLGMRFAIRRLDLAFRDFRDPQYWTKFSRVF